MRHIALSVNRFGLSTSLALAFFVQSISVAYAGDSLVGTVTAVKSANLITLDYGAGSYEVRIVGIDVGRDAIRSRDAARSMSAMVLGKQVRLRFDGRAPNGEMIGRIWIGGNQPEQPVIDVGVELVRNGLVLSQKNYREYKYGEMTRAESEAKRSQRGLWKTVEQRK